MELSAYQRAASETNQLRLGGPQGVIAPMLVLASETGSILNVHKKYLRDGIDLAANRAFLREELGDLLWYAAAVATACGLDLEEAAEANLRRARDRYPASAPNPPSGGVICLFWMPATRRVSGSRAAWWWPSQSGYCRPAAVPPA